MRIRIQLAALMFLAVTAVAQRNAPLKGAPPQDDMHTFQMVLIKQPGAGADANSQDMFFKHVRENANTALAGPVISGGDIRGVIVLDVGTKAEAETIASEHPAVRSGKATLETHPWWAARNRIKKAHANADSTYYLAFLTRGPAWSPEVTEATKKLQEAHLANIRRLAETGKLVLAGPFGDDGVLRGVFIFRVGSIEEAKHLADTDPAVQANRLKLDLCEWRLPQGIL